MGNLMVKGMALAATILLMRAFSPADYGIIMTMTSLMAVLPVMMDFGTTVTILRFGPSLDKLGLEGKRSQLFQVALRMRFLSGSLFLVVGVLIAKPLAQSLLHDPVQSTIIIIAVLGSLGASFLQLLVSSLQAQERFRLLTATNMVEGALKFSLVLGLVYLFINSGPGGAVVIYAFAPVLTVLIFLPFRPIPKLGGHKLELDVFKSFMKFSFWYMISQVCLMVFMNFDFLIIAALKGQEEVGYFGSGFKLASILFLVVQALNTVLLLGIGRAIGVQAFKQYVKKSILACTLIATVMIPLVFMGMPLIEFLDLDLYRPAARVFHLTAWDHLAMILFTPLLVTLFALNRPALLAGFVAVEMVMNIIGDLIFVPSHGAVGAAAVTLFTRVVIGSLGSLLLFLKIHRDPDFLKTII